MWIFYLKVASIKFSTNHLWIRLIKLLYLYLFIFFICLIEVQGWDEFIKFFPQYFTQLYLLKFYFAISIVGPPKSSREVPLSEPTGQREFLLFQRILASCGGSLPAKMAAFNSFPLVSCCSPMVRRKLGLYSLILSWHVIALNNGIRWSDVWALHLRSLAFPASWFWCPDPPWKKSRLFSREVICRISKGQMNEWRSSSGCMAQSTFRWLQLHSLSAGNSMRNPEGELSNGTWSIHRTGRKI